MDPLTERIRGHFDQLGEGEWERLTASPSGRIAFEVHRRMLAEHVRPGDHVLEAGAGPGRFTIALAELGARTAVTDLSPVQLELHRAREVEALVAGAPCRMLAISASNCMSLSDPETVSYFEVDPVRRKWFVDWEIRLCREPGALDGGTHIVFAVERLP
jgi:SAM-dependent methyltransferase